jgi:SSS family solute:Na+ symporter
MTIVSFILFLAFAGALTWFIVRKQDVGSNTGFFLAGRSLTYPLIAASLLLTNLSTEQMVGLNGSAFRQGLCVMAWEVVAVVSLVAMAWFFLPKFLKSGVTTVPEYLELRYGKSTGTIANAIFLFFYVFLLLPLILYTGATALQQILDFKTLLPGCSDTTILWIAIWLIGLMGCAYSLFGGLRTCAVLDTINGIGLLVGGFMIVFFALSKVSAVNGGELSLMQSLSEVKNAHADMFNTFGRPKSEVPFGTLFTGVLIINMFYWCTNQQIIQRTFGAKGLAEGQKGVLLCGLLKLLGPLYLVLPGMIAFYFACKGLLDLDMNSSALAYGKLVTFVLPNWLAGFFGAVLIGAVLSSFNGALNSSCTLFSIGFYKGLINPQAEDKKVVRSGRIFGFIIAVLCMCGAPLLANTSSIFDYLQKTNGIYNIPLFAIIVVGMLTKFVPKMAANVALFVGVVLIAFLTFGDPAVVQKVTGGMNIYHVDTIVFLILVAIMGIWSFAAPRKEAFVQEDVKAVDMTPWKFSWVAGGLLLVLVALIYASFADFSALKDKDTEPVPYHWNIIAVEIANKEMKALEISEDEQGVIITEIKANIDEFDKSKDKPADTAVTRKIVYQTIGKHYAKAKGFTEAQIEAFNKVVERETARGLKEADDLKAATEPAIKKFFESAKEELKKAAEDVKGAADAAKKDAEKAADDAKKEGESAVDSVNNGVEGVTTGVGQALEGAVNSVSKGIEGVTTGISNSLNNR